MYHMRRITSYAPPYPNMPVPHHSGFGTYPPNGFYQAPMQMGHMHAQQYMNPPPGGNNLTSQLFHNPLQADEEHLHSQYQGGYSHPYHIPKLPQPPQTGHFNSFLNSFKSQSGSLDLNKMMDTAGQMMNALTQVSNMAKGLGSLFKT
ncbi:YppG family protein [Siminovitchia fortis]|uniref:YppG family protein n=1 Tax=Siminovitchia fortis TaxID=254758 RepID=UPI0011A20A0D|nr:YppG family protein [Siminovitchia fortis]